MRRRKRLFVQYKRKSEGAKTTKKGEKRREGTEHKSSAINESCLRGEGGWVSVSGSRSRLLRVGEVATPKLVGGRCVCEGGGSGGGRLGGWRSGADPRKRGRRRRVDVTKQEHVLTRQPPRGTQAGKQKTRKAKKKSGETVGYKCQQLNGRKNKSAETRERGGHDC